MIAKVTSSGAGVAGLVDYLYEGREENRKKNDKKAEVITHSKDLQMPRDANDLAGRKELISAFENQAKKHTNRGNYVGMHVLSFSKNDMEKLNKEDINHITDDYIKMAQFEDTQYFAIAHHDTDHYHLHLVFNRINNQGKKYVDKQEKIKTTYRAIAISLNYGLKLKGKSFKLGQSFRVAQIRHGQESISKLIENDPTGLLQRAQNIGHLRELAVKRGIKVLEYWSQTKANEGKEPEKRIPIEASFNHTKIGDQEYRNEDMRAIFYRNTVHAKAQNRPHRIETEKEAQAYNFGLEIPINHQELDMSHKLLSQLKNYSGALLQKDKQGRQRKKLADHELKIQKVQKSRGIKV